MLRIGVCVDPGAVGHSGWETSLAFVGNRTVAEQPVSLPTELETATL
jgi:hypothetical protein